MKKWQTILAVVGIGTVLMGSTVQAAVPVEEVQQAVERYLENSGYNYTYNEDSECFELGFTLDCALGQTDVYIYVYDDMVSVVADSPLFIKEERFENMAIFTTLANNDMYYGQFRIDKEAGLVSCRNFNVIESIVPGDDEIDTLLFFVVDYMESYGDGIAALSVSDTDPYEIYDSIAEADLE